MSNHIPVMDELAFRAKVHIYSNYTHVIKEIENLEKFYKAKVLAGDIFFDPSLFKAQFDTRKIPWGPKGVMMHPRGPNGSSLDGKRNSSGGSWYPGQDARPDTPLANTPKSEAKEAKKLRWVPPNLSGDDKKSRWGPSTSVCGNNNYPSSALQKDSYL
jgi:hypothetical protein